MKEKQKLLDYKDPQRKHKLHTLVGALVALATATLLFILSEDKSWDIVLITPIVASFVAGIGKEIIDVIRNYKLDLGDVLATGIGYFLFLPLGVIIYNYL